MNMELLFQQPNALPSAPKIVQDLISSFNDENVSADDVARKLAADPVLSAKLLRLANSAYYHVSRSVSTVNEAVVMLGFVTVRALVISSGLVNGFKSAPGLDLKKFWHYSLNTSVAAKWLAGQTDENSELAFTVGMMHAIGQLVIHAGVPEQALLLDQAVAPLNEHRFDAERNSLGYNYAEVGAELAVRWKFPDAFSNAILAFPRPLEHQPFNPMAAIIHLAAWIAQANENGLSQDDLRANCPTEVAVKLGLDPFILLDQMPPLSELSNGLEELVA
jgi:HD-like signal output (HDOD) protein